jgi:hypothetical protein
MAHDIARNNRWLVRAALIALGWAIVYAAKQVIA